MNLVILFVQLAGVSVANVQLPINYLDLLGHAAGCHGHPIYLVFQGSGRH